MNKKRLLTSLMSIAMLASITTGATYALFTAEDTANIAVTSAKVRVKATLDQNSLKTYSMAVEQPYGTFENGGTATFSDESSLKLEKVTPGDAVDFVINATNESNVTIKYRISLGIEGELAAALKSKATIDNVEYQLNGGKTEWITVAAGVDLNDIAMHVELPEGAVNAYQEKDANITVRIDAVQGNGEWANYYVSDANGLKDALANGGEIVLMDNLTLENGTNFRVEEGVTALINLNGKTITGGYQTGSSEKHVYVIENHGDLVLTGDGTVAGRGVSNYGNLTVNGGYYSAIDTNGGGSIWNYTGGHVEVNGGTFETAEDSESPGPTCLNNAYGSTAVINGGTFIASANQTYGIINAGTLTINDIDITVDHGIVSTTGDMVINGGTFKQKGELVQTSAGLYVNGGVTTINGGTFNHNIAGKLDSGHVVTAYDATANIYGGTFTGGVAGVLGIYSSNSYINVYGGQYSGTVASYVANGYTQTTSEVDNVTWYNVVPEVEVNDPANLNDALVNAEPGSVVSLDSTVDYGAVNLEGEVKDVVINANNANVYFKASANSSLENVTFTNMNGDGLDRAIDIPSGIVAKNVVVENSTFADNSAAPYGAIYVNNPEAELTIRNCDFIDCKYAVYGSTPASKVTIEECNFKNVSSWAVLLNGADTTGAQLTINKCTFENCTGGIAKYLGSSQPEGAFTVFTNNILTNCAGHDGSDAKWFAIVGSTSTITVVNNKLNGVEWVPGTAQGLGK